MPPEEFGPLALPLMDALYRTARRLTRSGLDAEDLVQQTYLEAFRSFASLSQSNRCRAWMFSIMFNLWKDGLAKRRARPGLALVEVDGIPSPDADPQTELVAAAYSDHVLDALAALPEEYRVAVLLVDVEGHSYAEAASVIGCPQGTVRSRLARGRSLLTDRLSPSARCRAARGGSR
jgi:RNA polymerase sigma-70 factor (ECF subfamily)